MKIIDKRLNKDKITFNDLYNGETFVFTNSPDSIYLKVSPEHFYDFAQRILFTYTDVYNKSLIVKVNSELIIT